MGCLSPRVGSLKAELCRRTIEVEREIVRIRNVVCAFINSRVRLAVLDSVTVCTYGTNLDLPNISLCRSNAYRVSFRGVFRSCFACVGTVAYLQLTSACSSIKSQRLLGRRMPRSSSYRTNQRCSSQPIFVLYYCALFISNPAFDRDLLLFLQPSRGKQEI